MQDDIITALNNQITYLSSQEFAVWKGRELDDRARKYLIQAVQAARTMTPEGQMKACHALLMYADLIEMGDGSLASLKGTKASLEDQPQ